MFRHPYYQTRRICMPCRHCILYFGRPKGFEHHNGDYPDAHGRDRGIWNTKKDFKKHMWISDF